MFGAEPRATPVNWLPASIASVACCFPNSTGIPCLIFVTSGRSHHGCCSRAYLIMPAISIVFCGSAEATTQFEYG